MKITIKSRQKDISDSWDIHEYDGSFDCLNDKYFIRYTEKIYEDGKNIPKGIDPASLSEDRDNYDRTCVRTLVKVFDKSVEVTRQGAVNSRLVFCEGETLCSSYPTAYGNFEAEIYTKKIRISHENDSFSVRLFYSLKLNGTFVSDCDFELSL